jgi:quinol monooxygenase YgiN
VIDDGRHGSTSASPVLASISRVAHDAVTVNTILDRDRGGDMPIYSIWESRFPAARAAAGRAVTEAIWRDMQSFEGYLSHELLVDADDPGHLLVVSQWTSREHADKTLGLYATHPNARAANSLVTEPRRRFVATRADG